MNPSTLTFLLDRLFSNLFKMIKVGTTIRMRNVIIASFHPPPSAAAAARSISGRRPIPHSLRGLAGIGQAPSNLRRTSACALADSARSQIWGHGSGIPSLLRSIQNSGWNCLRLGHRAARYRRQSRESGPRATSSSYPVASDAEPTEFTVFSERPGQHGQLAGT